MATFSFAMYFLGESQVLLNMDAIKLLTHYYPVSVSKQGFEIIIKLQIYRSMPILRQK